MRVPGSLARRVAQRSASARLRDRHSLTVVDVERTTLTLRQIDERGEEIDRIRITRA